MANPEVLALIGASYGVTMFAVHRMGVYHRRAQGPDLQRLRRFDLRALLAELEPVYRAGLPREPATAVAWPQSPFAPPPFGAESPWESPSLSTLRNARDAFFAGEPIEPVPGPEFTSLAVHCWARWLAHGDVERARNVATALWDSAPTIFAKVAGYADLLLADAARKRGDERRAFSTATAALRALERVGAKQSDADLSSRYLAAHLRLGHLTSGWNLELSVFSTTRFVRRAIRDIGHAPCLYFALAHAAALAGRSEEAVDEIGRAVYYARGDPFYTAAVLGDDYIARIRPALVAQCRVETATGTGRRV